MNIKALVIRFGVGTLITAGASALAVAEPLIDLAAVEIVDAPAKPAAVRSGEARQPLALQPVTPRAGRILTPRRELQLADALTRQLEDQLERRLASQLQRIN